MTITAARELSIEGLLHAGPNTLGVNPLTREIAADPASSTGPRPNRETGDYAEAASRLCSATADVEPDSGSRVGGLRIGRTSV